VADRSPAGLWTASAALLTGRPVALLVPIVSTLAGTIVVLAAAVLAFRRREI
jgi:hypothetical protein